MVPPNWEHPKKWQDGRHDFVPLYNRNILQYCEPDDEDPPPSDEEMMPEWDDAEKTHYQMYETCTQGTPISPVMETPEELARWLADNNARAFGRLTATYEEWLGMIRKGSAPSAIIAGGAIRSGVAAVSANISEQASR